MWVLSVSIGVGYWAYTYSDWQTGIAFSIAVATIIGMVFIWRDPPSKICDHDNSGIFYTGFDIF
jgi:hypothetical protein